MAGSREQAKLKPRGMKMLVLQTCPPLKREILWSFFTRIKDKDRELVCERAWSDVFISQCFKS